MQKKRFDIQVAALIPANINEKLEQMARRRMRTKSDILRDAILEYIKRFQEASTDG